jgi:hypothetical protein
MPEALIARLRLLHDTVGESRARAIVGLSRNAYTRALAALPVHAGTIALIDATTSAWVHGVDGLVEGSDDE